MKFYRCSLPLRSAGVARTRRAAARYVPVMRLMADTVPVMIWMSGIDGQCTWFNKPWLTFVGRTLEDELGTGWTQNVHPDDVAQCVDSFMSAVKARRPLSIEYRLRRSDGAYRWVLDNGAPHHDAAGRFAGFIG